MDPDGFPNTLGEFPTLFDGDTVSAMDDQWNTEMAQVVDMIAPNCLLPSLENKSFFGFISDMKSFIVPLGVVSII